MSRLPIRVRMTMAFAAATALVLAGAGLFVYVQVRADLGESVTAELRKRAAVVLAAGDAAAGAPPEAEEGFAQILSPDGFVLDAVGGTRQPVIVAGRGERIVERRIGGVDGTTRVLARDDVVVGHTLQDRDDVLNGLIASFALGGPVAVLLASLLGYALAGAGLRPVEAMRRRAAEVSLAPDGERLPLPVARDEIRRLGETLNGMLDRLSRSFERERRFVADASHELRTPVAVLKTELEGALRAGGHEPAVRASLVAAVEECDHLVQLAEDLLVIARSGEGKLPVRPERLPVRPLLDGVQHRFADRAAEHGRHFRLELEDGIAVTADPLRLRQALGNLVDNALRHGAGEITLEASAIEDGVQLEIADEGPGFGDDIAGRAFERFTRGDAARTRGGTGLGLAIVRAIAEAHGGHATIDGATVRVWLPSQGRLSGALHDGSGSEPTGGTP